MAFWSAELVGKLVELHSLGTSSMATIAKNLGVSRNAVIGKCDRLGLPHRLNYDRHYYERGCVALQPKRKKQFFFGRPTRGEAVEQAVLPPPVSPLPPLRIPLTSTTRHQCKFIEGNDDLTCGRPNTRVKTAFGTTRELSWCDFHTSVVFRPRP